jgi:hypothetical protein
MKIKKNVVYSFCGFSHARVLIQTVECSELNFAENLIKRKISCTVIMFNRQVCVMFVMR